MPRCPACDGAAVVAETLRAEFATSAIEVTFRCEQDHAWTLADITTTAAEAAVREALSERRWKGGSHAALGLLLELTSKTDDAYAEYATALACDDTFDRAFCHERRATYEAGHGWLRNALRSMRRAMAADRDASGARQATYAQAITTLESALRAASISIRDDRDPRWERECELELPPGFGARNEQGEPLSDEVIEVERRIRAERWDDAVAAMRALRPNSSRLIDAIGYASRGAELAHDGGHVDAAIALQELVVEAYAIYASWATSGGEGLARTADVDRERERLRAWEYQRSDGR